MPDGGLHRVIVVSDVFLIICSSFSCLFVCHLIAHYPELACIPGEGYLVPFIMEGSKGVRMLLLSALLGGIAGWKFAIQSWTDWLSLTIQTFLCDSSVWIICNAFLIAFILACKGEHCVSACMAQEW